ncbi:MAG: PilZ domain-containing protein [Alphaproteobacteria bacterium]|nr:PilZ domain-containing protein [Alphaproteobacteria bacterium]
MPRSSSQIVHESETQRQHVRVGIPAIVRLNGREYQVKDLSVGGVSLADMGDIYRSRQNLNLQLVFRFTDFGFTLDLKAQVEYFDKSSRSLGCRFLNLTESQLSILNFIIKSHMNNAIVTEGDLLHVAGRSNFVQARSSLGVSPEEDRTSRVRKAVFIAFIALSGMLGLFFILGNIYESVSIIKSYQGTVKGDTVLSRTASEGTFHSLLPPGTKRVGQGQALAEINGLTIGPASADTSPPLKPFPDNVGLAPTTAAPPATGLPPQFYTVKRIVKSPCDCYVVHQFVRDGEFRGVGEPLFKLMPVNSRPWITATILPRDAHRLNLRNEVNIRIAGETAFVPGHVVSIDSRDEDVPITTVKILPQADLPQEVVGRPAYVEFLIY